jgi:hypothetical protein
MTTPTTETLNGGSTMVQRLEQTSDANLSAAGQKMKADASGNTFGVGSQVGPITVKPVDRRTITGSTPGDFRSQAAPAVMPAQPAPRAATNDELEGVGG